MKKTILTETVINAPVETVWSILTDFASFPQWNGFITEISGSLAVGSRLSVRVRHAGERAMRFAPRILVCRAPQELCWLGGLPARGLFDGEHFFQLKALPEGNTQFIHGEYFSGILVRFMAESLDKHTLPAFEQMNRELKQRAEKRAT